MPASFSLVRANWFKLIAKQQVPIVIGGIVRVHHLFKSKTTRQVAVSLNEPRSARKQEDFILGTSTVPMFLLVS